LNLSLLIVETMNQRGSRELAGSGLNCVLLNRSALGWQTMNVVLDKDPQIGFALRVKVSAHASE